MLAGLETAHRAGILHRDVKPGNVLLSADGRARLTDFGIAFSAGEAHLTDTGILLGSPAYIAPERARGMPGGPPSDLWALASTLYTVVEGTPAYEGHDALAVVTAVIEGQRRPARRAGTLDPLLADLLDRSAETRPRASEVRRRLSAIVAAGEPVIDLSEPHTLVLPAAVPEAATQQINATANTATQWIPAAGAGLTSFPGEQGENRGAPVAAPLPQQPPLRRRRRGRVLALVFVILIALLGGIALGVVLAKRERDRGSRPSARPATTEQSNLPKGWKRYRDPAVGYSVGVPSNWIRAAGPTATTTDFRDPYVRRFVRVDTTSAPQASALAAWQAYEASFRTSVQNYSRVRLVPSDGGNGTRQADWEFTFVADGVTYHALDRGLVVNGRGYALYWQTEQPKWQSSSTLREQLFAQFTPAP